MAGRALAIPQGWFEVQEPEYQAVCPHCSVVLEIRTPLRGTGPEPGWFNVCLECGGVSVFQRDGSTLTLRMANDDEI